MAITREDIVEQSVTDWIREQLFDVRDYPTSQIEIIDRFPSEGLPQPIDKNYIALGFGFDQGGESGEMGSDLRFRTYVFEFFVFGRSHTWAKNLANTIKFSADVDNGRIPLLDITDTEKPVIDYLIVEGTNVEHQAIANPEPWQEHVFLTTVRVEDQYFASEA